MISVFVCGPLGQTNNLFITGIYRLVQKLLQNFVFFSNLVISRKQSHVYWGDTPIRTPGRVSVARSEIVIRFLGCPNPENHRVSDLPAPLVGKSRFFTGVQIPEFRIPGV